MAFECTGTPSCDCIATTKVYDYCYQSDTFDVTSGTFSCTTVPSSLSCTVSIGTCTLLFTTAAVTPNYVLATFQVTGTVTLGWTCGTVAATDAVPFWFTKPGGVLCSPEGTYQVCDVVNVGCAPYLTQVGVATYEVSASVGLCMTFESDAEVKILVQTFGFCSPPLCESGGLLPCPPSPLFPPQVCDP